MSRHGKPYRLDPVISDALRDQTLLTRWYEKADGRRYLSMFSTYNGALRSQFKDMRLDQEGQFADLMHHALLSAETFAVAPDMHELLLMLLRGSPEDTVPPTMELHELIAPAGFVRLPHPIIVPDINEIRYPERAMMWYVDPIRLDGETKTPLVLTAFFTDRFKEDPANDVDPWIGPPISLLHFTSVRVGDLREAFKYGELGKGSQYLVLFWLIANQYLAAIEDVRPVGLIAQQAREHKIIPRLRVIRLRRERVEQEEHDPTGREYSHRWTVRAHWRHQPCGPGRQDRKWVLVRAHVRGPDDKPLVVKQRAFILDR